MLPRKFKIISYLLLLGGVIGIILSVSFYNIFSDGSRSAIFFYFLYYLINSIGITISSILLLKGRKLGLNLLILVCIVILSSIFIPTEGGVSLFLDTISFFGLPFSSSISYVSLYYIMLIPLGMLFFWSSIIINIIYIRSWKEYFNNKKYS